MAGLHAHESSQNGKVKMEKCPYFRSFQNQYIVKEVAGLFGLQAEVSWLHSCHAQFKPAEVWWWAGVFSATTCIRVFFPLVVVVVGGVSLSLSLLSFLPPSLPAFLSLVFWPAVPVVWWSPSVLLTFRCFCQFWSSRHPSQWNVIRRKVNTPLVHLQQHLMPLEGISQSAFNSASAASSGMVLSSHKQDLWKENDTVNMLLM